jgi:hypothetical protein
LLSSEKKGPPILCGPVELDGWLKAASVVKKLQRMRYGMAYTAFVIGYRTMLYTLSKTVGTHVALGAAVERLYREYSWTPVS